MFCLTCVCGGFGAYLETNSTFSTLFLKLFKIFHKQGPSGKAFYEMKSVKRLFATWLGNIWHIPGFWKVNKNVTSKGAWAKAKERLPRDSLVIPEVVRLWVSPFGCQCESLHKCCLWNCNVFLSLLDSDSESPEMASYRFPWLKVCDEMSDIYFVAGTLSSHLTGTTVGE